CPGGRARAGTPAAAIPAARAVVDDALGVLQPTADLYYKVLFVTRSGVPSRRPQFMITMLGWAGVRLASPAEQGLGSLLGLSWGFSAGSVPCQLCPPSSGRRLRAACLPVKRSELPR